MGRKLSRSRVWVDSLSQATLSVKSRSGGGETSPDQTCLATLPSARTALGELAVVTSAMRQSASGLASRTNGTSA